MTVLWLTGCGASEADRLLGPFFEAVQNENTKEIKSMLAEVPDLAITSRADGMTALHQAAWNGNTEIAEILLKSGADVLKKSAAAGALGAVRIIGFRRVVSPRFAPGTTALHVAAHAGHLDAVQALISNGADVNALDSAGNAPLELAGQADQIPVLVALLKAGADYKGQGFSELWADLMLGNPAGALEKLAAEAAQRQKSSFGGVEINRTEGRHRLLHWAVMAGASEVVRELLRQGADVNGRNYYFETALHEAAARGALEIADVLIKSKADLNPRSLNQPAVKGLRSDYTPLHFAVVFGHLEVAELLIVQTAHLNARDEEGWTPLHWAVSLGNLEMATLLLDSGADLQRTTRMNRTALHVASAAGQLLSAEWLIKQGLNVNEKDRDKNTPLHLAVSGGYVELAKLLLDAGADQTARDGYGKSPMDLAGESRNSALIALFVKASG